MYNERYKGNTRSINIELCLAYHSYDKNTIYDKPTIVFNMINAQEVYWTYETKEDMEKTLKLLPSV